MITDTVDIPKIRENCKIVIMSSIILLRLLTHVGFFDKMVRYFPKFFCIWKEQES